MLTGWLCGAGGGSCAAGVTAGCDGLILKQKKSAGPAEGESTGKPPDGLLWFQVPEHSPRNFLLKFFGIPSRVVPLPTHSSAVPC